MAKKKMKEVDGIQEKEHKPEVLNPGFVGYEDWLPTVNLVFPGTRRLDPFRIEILENPHDAGSFTAFQIFGEDEPMIIGAGKDYVKMTRQYLDTIEKAFLKEKEDQAKDKEKADASFKKTKEGNGEEKKQETTAKAQRGVKMPKKPVAAKKAEPEKAGSEEKKKAEKKDPLSDTLGGKKKETLEERRARLRAAAK